MTFQKPSENRAWKSLTCRGRKVNVEPFLKQLISEQSKTG
jgi:hypothetical protein